MPFQQNSFQRAQAAWKEIKKYEVQMGSVSLSSCSREKRPSPTPNGKGREICLFSLFILGIRLQECQRRDGESPGQPSQ